MWSSHFYFNMFFPCLSRYCFFFRLGHCDFMYNTMSTLIGFKLFWSLLWFSICLIFVLKILNILPLCFSSSLLNHFNIFKASLLVLIGYIHNILENSYEKIMKNLRTPKDSTSAGPQIFEWSTFSTSVDLICKLLVIVNLECFPTKHVVR